MTAVTEIFLFVCAGSLRKGSRNYMNRMTDKLCRTYDELERCKGL